jgi:glycosyltransferase involved in cell wall biosynthesis
MADEVLAGSKAMRTVSVIMPCFNHSGFVRESAMGVLSQTHPDLELIIVDDCSSDDSWSIITALAAEDHRVRPIRHERNRGAATSRNDGIRAARGEFIAFCDADDVWHGDKVATQIALLDRRPDHDVAYSDSHVIDSRGEPTGHRFSEMFAPPARSSGWLFSTLVKTNFINTQSVLMRRTCVERVGMFDESLKGAAVEDWWYWIQLSHEHRFAYSPECLGKYRVHSGSTGIHRNYSVSRFKVFRRILETYSDLPVPVRARALLGMGIYLCELGRIRAGRRLLLRTMAVSVAHPAAYPTAARALRQLLIRARRPRQKPAQRSLLAAP